MTRQELLDFAVENAGKMATGKDRVTAEIRHGRIIAFKFDQWHNALVLLENDKGQEKKDLPNPLTSVPLLFDNWYRVVSPAKMGYPVKADTVVVDEQASDGLMVTADNNTGTLKDLMDNTQPRVCPHPECDTWCHRAYSGVI